MNEHEHQATLFRWAALYERDLPELELLYANPLGGQRPHRTGVKLKREGVKAGIPDMFLPVAKGTYHGLFIELKRPNGPNGSGKGVVTQAQDWWLRNLAEQGYRCEVCYGWVEAADVILDYLIGMTLEEYSELSALRRSGNG